MNKSELIVALAQKADISKKDAEKAISAFIDVVTETLKAGDKVQLVGFGTFESKGTPRPRGPQSPHRRRNHHRSQQDRFLPGWQGPQGQHQLMNFCF